jgi:hypothetical protein
MENDQPESKLKDPKVRDKPRKFIFFFGLRGLAREP